ncbi:MAG TPA: MBL fold metallo-hydrolase [Dehalococcoidia bacterium]|nr:MBL fold metallo-hydrolase [Dehalococcoidia bacterium]
MGHWFRLGDLELLVVSDGVIRQDAGATFGLIPRVMWERFAPDLDAQNRISVGNNSLLIRAGGKTVLLDTGVGPKPTRAPGAMAIEDTGRLLANLSRIGIRPEDIDIVVNTHLHFDHCGGNTAIDDRRLVPAFPRARYFIQKGEWEAATHPNERTRGTYLAENFEPLADARQVELGSGEVEVAKGVRVVPAPGHTEDHCVIELESGGRFALYVGELSQHPIMLERLAWISAFDVLPLVSLETKRRLTDWALEKRALLISVHAPYPGLGQLRMDDGKRRWEETRGNGVDL